MHLPPRSTSCTPPPAQFTSFSPPSCDTISYCASTSDTKTFVWNGNDGEVTREEVESALANAGSQTVVKAPLQGNVLAYGDPARAARNVALLYQVTGDVRALDILVRYADNVLYLQNSPTTGTTTWNDISEPVWMVSNGSFPTSEQGAIVYHLASAAVEILRTPCVYDLVPSIPSGWPVPDGFTSGTTYMERAIAYIAAGDLTYNDYFFPLFFDNNGLLIQPNDTRWNPNNEDQGANEAGGNMAWNRRQMVLQGLIRLADAHELLPPINTTFVAKTDSLIEANIKDFVGALNATKSKTGSDTWWWGYRITTTTTPEEASDVHGWYDVWGLFQAWQRNPTLYGITNDTMIGIANTFGDTINLGNNLTSGYIDGTSGSGNTQARNQEGGLWGLYGYWRKDVYEITVAAAQDNTGTSYDGIYLLWMKHAFQINDDKFWRARYSNSSASTGTSPTSNPSATTPTTANTHPSNPSHTSNPSNPTNPSNPNPTTPTTTNVILYAAVAISIFIIAVFLVLWMIHGKSPPTPPESEQSSDSDSDSEETKSDTTSASSGSDSEDSKKDSPSGWTTSDEDTDDEISSRKK